MIGMRMSQNDSLDAVVRGAADGVDMEVIGGARVDDEAAAT